ncbi:hypothetical protein PUMCH_001662 [Australozyma saopauloensis]|uniref:Uncharacterized protein n=1 Tax=Australozyma saopauloensis TaxID=291208 RepID=A0AAX4H7K9_9ASCO|nr:hypothetical protein PUMCH_001662 [[Candida] saopauloensis]
MSQNPRPGSKPPKTKVYKENRSTRPNHHPQTFQFRTFAGGSRLRAPNPYNGACTYPSQSETSLQMDQTRQNFAGFFATSQQISAHRTIPPPNKIPPILPPRKPIPPPFTTAIGVFPTILLQTDASNNSAAQSPIFSPLYSQRLLIHLLFHLEQADFNAHCLRAHNRLSADI